MLSDVQIPGRRISQKNLRLPRGKIRVSAKRHKVCNEVNEIKEFYRRKDFIYYNPNKRAEGCYLKGSYKDESDKP